MKRYGNYSQSEMGRVLLLRAMEWLSWPAFLSMGVGQLLLLRLSPLTAIALVAVLNFIWSLFCTGWVSLRMAEAGVFIKLLGWLTTPVVAIYFIWQSDYRMMLVAICWPVISIFLQLAGIPRKIGPVEEQMHAQLISRGHA